MQNLNLNLDIDELDREAFAIDSFEENKTDDLSGIAIIGIDAKLGNAATRDEIWQAFLEGKDMVSDLSAIREEDAQQYLLSESGKRAVGFVKKAYLPRIDLFDPGLFNISPMEAELIEPAQKIFLESAWAALEDAGYGGKKLSGSRTGVYVGYNSMSSRSDIMAGNVPDEAFGLVVSGQVNSFIASRLSYLLNLTGPAMVIDTACSSSLVALHEACRALKNKDISMAVVGSVRVFLCPEDNNKEMGTTSSTGLTKTFDEKADGTGGGEGVINLILKPLSAAVASNDHIYGVIKGSCINQDGNCIGLTAPNSAAQEEVIAGAWKDAGIDPDKITYIEAHGTATRLGDPVEIGGLTGAFARYTDKKQFCAIGAAKSNFGHLDCAAGLVGVLKVLLMMQNKVIPPTIHFYTPNRKIDYLHSPVYINDKAKPWETDDGVLLAGVSSFGLSGTNSHVVLQSYNKEKKQYTNSCGKYLLTASAKEDSTLQKLLVSYQEFMKANPNTDVQDFCYTVNTGRGQYQCRFAMVFSDVLEFTELNTDELLSEKLCGKFSVVTQSENISKGMILQSTQNSYTEQAKKLCRPECIEELATLYLKGAEIDFEPLYADEEVSRISVPTYPFNNKRYWYVLPKATYDAQKKDDIYEKAIHPLIDRCGVESCKLWVFEKLISTESCLEIREHKITGVHVLPGTAYVEMAYAIGREVYHSANFTFSEVTFYSLLTCRTEEKRILHSIVNEDNDTLSIRMLSRSSDDEEWSIHAEILLKRRYELKIEKKVDLQKLLASYDKVYAIKKQSNEEKSFVQLGEHWQSGKTVCLGESSVVLCAEVQEELAEDMAGYYLFPALLDGAVNAGIALLDAEYLPLNYKNANFYGRLRGKIYSKVTRINADESAGEVELFHVEIMDEEGVILGEVEQYALKRCNESDKLFESVINSDLHEIEWQPEENVNEQTDTSSDYALVVLKEGQEADLLLGEIENTYSNTVCLYLGDHSEQIDRNYYMVGNTEGEITAAIQQLNMPKNAVVINLLGNVSDSTEHNEAAFTKLHGTFNLAKALYKCSRKLTLATIVQNAGAITGREACYNPINQSIVGFTSCIVLEQNNIDVCIIDTDEQTDPKVLLSEINHKRLKTVAGYRENVRYVEHLGTRLHKAVPIEPKDGDVVVIAGGYGGIGLAVSDYLFSHYKNMKIVLLSRNGVTNDDTDGRKASFERLLNKGYQISVYKSDMTDYDQTLSAINRVRQEYGHIDGIIYAAGLGTMGTLFNKNWADEWRVIKTKTIGVWNIDRATQKDRIRYFIMFSSFTSVLGAGGQTDYSAANAFLDSYAYERNRRVPGTMTINWTGWKDSGMSANFEVDWKNSIIRFVSDEEGKELFGEALRSGRPRIAICQFQKKLNRQDVEQLQKRIYIPKELLKIEDEKSEELPVEELVIYGKSYDKLTDIEKKVALAWARTLRVNEVNIYSKFFETGGNSLLASYLQKEINRIYPDSMAITDVFAYSTIADIAKYISEKLGIASDTEIITEEEAVDIEDLVQQFVSGELSLEEMEQLI